MGRFAFRSSVIALIIGLFSCSLLISCSGGSSATQVTKDVVPAIVTLSPSPNASVEIGKTLIFTAQAENGLGATLAETFTFTSSAPNVVTVANDGLACAGSWDSLVAPTLCTPGATGVAQVTAVANGVPSPPVTVYVHDHVTSVVIQRVPGQTPTLSSSCLSRGAPAGPEQSLLEAFAFNGSTDVTSSVGPFTWQSSPPAGQLTTSAAVTLLPVTVTQPLNQEIVQADMPGSTFIFASAGAVNSQPLPVTTCPVQSIAISAQNFASNQTSFRISSGTAVTLNAVVTDSAGQIVTGVPLVWNTSNPASVTVGGGPSTAFGSSATVTSPAAGSAAVTVSCTPPSCNGGILPSMPIYPTRALTFIVQAPPSTTVVTSPIVYVTSTGCLPIATTCNTQIVPITRSSATAPFAAGTPVALPFAPNSALFDRTGTNEYFGVGSTAFGTRGAMLVSGGTSASAMQNVAGEPLAASPDGTTVVFSDTVDSPQQILICVSCSASSRTITRLLLCDPTSTTCSTNSAAAAFSPDSLKAYIVSGNPCPGTSSAGCLVIYSKVDAAQYVQLAAPATDVAFIGNGTLGYMAGGSAAGAESLSTCIQPNASGLPGGNAIGAAAQFLRTLPDGQSVLALSSPNLLTITANISGSSTMGTSGCPAPRGFLNINNAVTAVGNLGTGSFTPSQFFLSPDGTTAYVLGAPTLPFIIQFNLTTGIPLEISLTGNATPLSASLSQTGDLLFVGASDSTVHVIDTTSLADIQQVTFPFPQNSMCIGPGTPVTQVQTQLTITGATRTGTTTTYAYTSLTGPALQTSERILITGMANFSNNGRFAIAALGSGTFSVVNPNGITAGSQNGTGISGTICTPDLVAVRP